MAAFFGPGGIGLSSIWVQNSDGGQIVESTPSRPRCYYLALKADAGSVPCSTTRFLALPHYRGTGHSLHSVDYTIPTALGQDPQPVILKISKSIGTTREHFHFGVEALGNAVGLGKAPHPHDGFQPRSECRRQ